MPDIPVLRRALAALRRYRTPALVFFVATLAGTAFFTFRQVPMYRADSVLELRWFPSNQRFPFQDVGMQRQSGYWSFEEFRNTQMQIIRSRRVMQRVVDVLGLEGVSASGISGQITVQPISESHLIRIQAVNRDAERAAALANAVAEVYIDIGIEDRVRHVQQTVNWLEDRVREIQKDISRSEETMVEFQQKHRTLGLDRDRSQLENEIEALRGKYIEAHAERIRLEGRLKEAEAYAGRGSEGLEKLATTISDEGVQELRKSLAAARSQRAERSAVFGPEHPKMVAVGNRIDDLRTQLREAGQDEVSRIRTDWELAKAEEAKLQESIDAKVDRALDRSPVWLEYRDLRGEMATGRELYDLLLQRFREVDITRDLNREQVAVIERAVAPSRPFRPNVQLNLAAGLLLALGGAVGIALAWSAFQQTIQNGEDLEAVSGVPPLVELPYLATPATEYPLEQVMMHDPDSPFSESFRGVRNHILFSPRRRGVRQILFTGAQSGEGKTTVANNVAIALAQAGRRVLLVDGDFRRQATTGLWGLLEDIGLGEVLTGRSRWQDALQLTSVPNLYLLGTGQGLDQSLETFRKEVLERVLAGMRQEFDLVVIDGTPLLAVADAMVLSALADETFLVLEAGRVHKRDIDELREVLDRVGQKMHEVILNKVTVPSGRFLTDAYAYGYGYGQPPKPGATRETGGSGAG